MIEINLLEQIGEKKAATTMPLGIELKNIPVVPLIIAIVVWWGSGKAISMYHETISDTKNKEIKKIEMKTRVVSREIRATKEIRELLDDIDKKKESLKLRTKRVKKILNTRSNPMKALERIAVDMNSEVWLEIVTIDRRDILIEGKAFTYSGISNFLRQAVSSKYFQNSLNVSNQGGRTEKLELPNGKNMNVEHFRIKGKILVFE